MSISCMSFMNRLSAVIGDGKPMGALRQDRPDLWCGSTSSPTAQSNRGVLALSLPKGELYVLTENEIKIVEGLAPKVVEEWG